MWRGYAGGLGANPIEFITHATGDWTLRFLVITLAVTPLRKLLGMPGLIRFRRMLGLFAFFYGCLHFITYLWLDKFFDVHEMLEDVAKRPFITAGFTAFVLMVPLAVTSTAGLDPPAGREALAPAAPAGLFERGRGRGALLLAGEVGYARARWPTARCWPCCSRRGSCVAQALGLRRPPRPPAKPYPLAPGGLRGRCRPWACPTGLPLR